METKDTVIYFLTGPTAVGKTELALAWAEANGAEILSCDSLLVYRGMAIGTARPCPESLLCVRHHGIDLSPVKQQFNVKKYLEVAQSVVDDVSQRRKKLLVVGGSGFYLKAFFAPVVDNLKVPDAVHREVLRLYQKKGLNGLVEQLRRLNPSGMGNLDLSNSRRVIKALERCLASGKTLIALRAEFESQPWPFEAYQKKICLLTRDRSSLLKRVEVRTKAMLAGGLIEEVRELIGSGMRDNPSAASAIGYRETLACLDGKEDFKDLEALIIKNTMALIRKQDTWFRRQIPVDRIIDLDVFKDEEVPGLFNK